MRNENSRVAGCCNQMIVKGGKFYGHIVDGREETIMGLRKQNCGLRGRTLRQTVTVASVVI